MNAGLFSVLGLCVILGSISGSDIYPSIHWVPQNPIFIADGVTCAPGPRHLKVQLQSKVNFICPNTATVLQKTLVGVQTANMYENLWIVYNKTVFDECDTSLEGESKTSRLLLQCDTPTKLNYFQVLFVQYTAEPDGLRFEGGKTYYFIGTSNGTEKHINDTRGGHCADTSNNIYMKIEVYVCEKSNQTYQDPKCKTGVGKLECPRVSTVKPSTSIAKTTPIPSKTAQAPQVASTEPAHQTVYSTHTVHSTQTLLSPQTVSLTTIPAQTVQASQVASTEPANQTVYSTQAVHSTQMLLSPVTVSSTAIPTKRVQASQVASTKPAPSSVIPSKTVPVALISTKNVPCEVTFTKTVSSAIPSSELCKRCNSKPKQTAVSVNSKTNESDGQKESNNEGMWKTVAILFVVLFCLLIVGLIAYITCGKRIWHRHSFIDAAELKNDDL